MLWRRRPLLRFSLALVLLGLVCGCNDFGTKLKFKSGELYYTRSVTREEADKLGEQLLKDGFFNNEAKTVQLSRSGDTYEVRLVIKPEFQNDTNYHRLLGIFGAELSQKVFAKAPVTMHVCDVRLKTVATIDPFPFVEANGGTLCYDATLSKPEVESLRDHLIKEKFFDGTPKSLLVQKDGKTIDLRMMVRPDAEKNPALASAFKTMAQEVSRKAFAGAPVRLCLCNEKLMTVKVVSSDP
jgi:hypothetical protein